MTSIRPYLIRAFYEWIVANQYTPHILVNAEHEGVKAPSQHIKDGKIVLNIAPGAVQSLIINNEELTCNARFNGVAMILNIPVMAVLAIYARENGQGMVFGEEPGPTEPATTAAKSIAKRPALRLVK